MRHVETRAGIYRDSVALMQISATLTRESGIERALVAMATGMNLELLAGMGFEVPGQSTPTDMLVAIVAADADSLARGLARLDAELAGPSPRASAGGGVETVSFRTTNTAARATGSTIALVSTPGPYAFVEAMDALDAGSSVMIFSDNVPVWQEVLLKRTAADRGLLVLGPDCGTAVISGVGLGFANVVRPGPVGLVAASGTGAQQVLSLLASTGVSHCLGVGGRDMSTSVGGLSTVAAMDILDADPHTELIVVMGKPPAPEVAERVAAQARSLATPVLMAPLGPGLPDLTAIAEEILRRLGRPVPTWPCWTTPSRAAGPGHLRGLFSGGTLCAEAMVIATEALGPIRSNVPLRPEWTMTGESGHSMVDLGADEYTVGRPHPMIDLGPRLALIDAHAADPDTRVLLLDVVLGHGAHPDPAAALAPTLQAVRASRPDDLAVVISLVGTVDDPQGFDHQAQVLHATGADVFTSNAAATRHAMAMVT